MNIPHYCGGLVLTIISMTLVVFNLLPSKVLLNWKKDVFKGILKAFDEIGENEVERKIFVPTNVGLLSTRRNLWISCCKN